jgi:hypothetical protein
MSYDIGHVLFQGDPDLYLAAPNPSSQYHQFIESSLPAIRGWWSGGSTNGVMAGHKGFFGIHFARADELFIEFPRSYRRERTWQRYVRQNVTCIGSDIWMTDYKTSATRLQSKWTSAQTMLLTDQYGGSGVGHVQSEALIGAELYNLETGFNVR